MLLETAGWALGASSLMRTSTKDTRRPRPSYLHPEYVPRPSLRCERVSVTGSRLAHHFMKRRRVRKNSMYAHHGDEMYYVYPTDISYIARHTTHKLYNRMIHRIPFSDTVSSCQCGAGVRGCTCTHAAAPMQRQIAVRCDASRSASCRTSSSYIRLYRTTRSLPPASPAGNFGSIVPQNSRLKCQISYRLRLQVALWPCLWRAPCP